MAFIFDVIGIIDFGCEACHIRAEIPGVVYLGDNITKTTSCLSPLLARKRAYTNAVGQQQPLVIRRCTSSAV